ncbi:MAG: flippase [Candidatus Hadarchaeales archaeon]
MTETAKSESKSRARYLVRASTMLFIVWIFASFIGLFVRIFLTRSLSREDYGVFFATIAFFSIFSFRDLGFNQSMLKYLPEFNVRKEYDNMKSSIAICFFVTVIYSSIILLLVIIFSDQIAVGLFHSPKSSLILKLMGGWFFFDGCYYVAKFSLLGVQDIDAFVLNDFLYSFLLLVFLLLFVTILPNLCGVALGYFVGIGIVAIIVFAILLKRHSQIFATKIKLSRSLFKKLFSFAIPAQMSGFAAIVFVPLVTIFLTAFRTFSEVGLFQVALPLASLLGNFHAFITPSLFPMISEMWARGEKSLIARTMEIVLKFSLVILTFVVLIFLVFPELVISLIFGPKYIGASSALQILSVYVTISNFTVLINCAVAGVGKPALVTLNLWITYPLIALFALFLIPSFGIEGASFAFLVPTIWGFFLSLFFARRLFQLRMSAKSIIKILAGGAISLLIIWGLKIILDLPVFFETFLVLLLSLIFYSLWLLRLKAIEREDLLLLKKVVPVPKWVLQVFRKLTPP